MNIRRLFRPNRTAREKDVVDILEKSLSIRLDKMDLYLLALRHKSAARNIHNRPDYSNERLEFLGDAILDAAVADYLFRKYPDSEEGELTKMKSRLVSRTHLNRLAALLGIDLLLETDLQATHSRTSLGGNALEAIFGAIYLDRGYNTAHQCIISLLENKVELTEVEYTEADFKSRLYEEAHRRKSDLKFTTRISGESEGKKVFHSEVFLDRKALGTGSGMSKKTAEQVASEQALKTLNLLHD